ncbi:MAG: hypothetical protein ACRC30_02955 [Clostridium sp.]
MQKRHIQLTKKEESSKNMLVFKINKGEKNNRKNEIIIFNRNKWF